MCNTAGVHERQVIHIHPQAPSKPALGQPCNGCGVCCLAEPCPLGMLVSLRVRGACRALVWDEPSRRYLCGLLRASTAAGKPLWLGRWVARMIGAQQGCDATLEVEHPSARQNR